MDNQVIVEVDIHKHLDAFLSIIENLLKLFILHSKDQYWTLPMLSGTTEQSMRSKKLLIKYRKKQLGLSLGQLNLYHYMYLLMKLPGTPWKLGA